MSRVRRMRMALTRRNIKVQKTMGVPHGADRQQRIASRSQHLECRRQPNSMRKASSRHLMARGLARALLADAGKPGGTTVRALQARAAAALGQRPSWLRPVLEPLAALSPITWQKFDVTSLARRLEASPAFALAFSEENNEDADDPDEPQASQPNDDQDDPEPERPPRIRRLILRPPVREHGGQLYAGSRRVEWHPALCARRPWHSR